MNSYIQTGTMRITIRFRRNCLCVMLNMLTSMFTPAFARDERSSYDDNEIHIESIERNAEFWEGCVRKAEQFFSFACCLSLWAIGILGQDPTIQAIDLTLPMTCLVHHPLHLVSNRICLLWAKHTAFVMALKRER